jgi:hypothetical protein
MNLENVTELARQYDEKEEQRQPEIAKRFKDLVDKPGVQVVCAATGLTESTVVVYAYTKTRRVSEHTLLKAEAVLSQI